jgi:hypothetical protein
MEGLGGGSLPAVADHAAGIHSEQVLLSNKTGILMMKDSSSLTKSYPSSPCLIAS